MMVSVAHLIATNRARGAEKFAIALADSLGTYGLKQEIVVIRSYGNTHHSENVPEVAMYFRAPPFPSIFWEALSFRRLLNRANPDVVLCHGLRTAKVARLACLFRPKKPILVMKKIGMTSDWVRRNRVIRNTFSRWVLRGMSKIVVLGPAQFREVTEIFRIPPNSVVHIPNGRPVDPTLESSPVWGRILFVGSLEREKGPDVALRVFRDVHSRNKSARLRFLGEGSLRTALEELAVSLGVREFVDFQGHVDDVNSELRSASAMLMSSRTEGVPGAAIEAAIAGLPVVAWDVGDIAAVVEDGVSGVLVRSGDEAALGAALLEVISSDSRRRELSIGAKAKSSVFDIAVVSRMYIELLNSLSHQVAQR